jgi:Spy/CpxP family protein refolding chaperone
MKAKLSILCGMFLLVACAAGAQGYAPMPAIPAPAPAASSQGYAPMPATSTATPIPAAAPAVVTVGLPPIAALAPAPAGWAQGQQPSMPAPGQGRQPMPAPAPAAPIGPDPIARNLFAPEQIMGHAEEIGLTPEQRNAIRDEIRGAQKQFTDLQWQLEDAVDAMGTLLKPSAVDEKAALAQLEKVLDLERSIKRAQMGLMIRIKNKLTPNQQSQLGYLGRMQMPAQPPPRNPPIE